MALAAEHYRRAMRDPAAFCALGGVTLRPYQQVIMQALVDAVVGQPGRSIAVMFPRQSGKNEVQAQAEAYLLALFSGRGGDIVKICPTLYPQCANARRRLLQVLQANPITRGRWRPDGSGAVRLGEARVCFFSAAPASNIVGATASLLLQVDEAQQVNIEKFDREVAPMAAASNAPRAFWGTPWTADTLLARELRRADAAFTLTAADVAAVLPAYGAFVAEQVARLGRDHPSIRTQYFGEEIGGGGGLFVPGSEELVQGSHPAQAVAVRGRTYAFLIDVGGESVPQGAGLPAARAPEHDLTALTIVEVDLGGQANPALRLPVYRAVHRRAWQGQPLAALHTHIQQLAAQWQPQALVIDATGIGAGLASILTRSLPKTSVIPFVFSAASKSQLGWDFLHLVETGRWQEPVPGGDPAQDGLRAQFLRQMAAATCAILPGPAATMRWSVPDRTRDPLTGRPLHDDLLVSAALVTRLDTFPWRSRHGFVPGVDPLVGMRGF